MRPATGLFWLVLVLAATAPALALVLVVPCLLAEAAMTLLRVAPRAAPMAASIVAPHPALPKAAAPQRPFFSVHLACRDEPPALVCRTIAALLAQDWPAERLEIIVIDNNTRDPARWRPLREYCARQRGRVRFLHRMGVSGAKAGALNIALARTSPDATHVVTIDSDYVVVADFLSSAARILRESGCDFLQFPQAYSHGTAATACIERELDDYFTAQALPASAAGVALPTGTLSVIAAPALRAVGGWTPGALTEDADLGYRLFRAGFRGLYVDRVVGRGLLPLRLGDFERQRARWASGNIRVMGQALSDLAARTGARPPAGAGRWRRSLMVLSQLSAWASLQLVPAAALLGAAFAPAAAGRDIVLTCAGASLMLGLVRIAVPLGWRNGPRAGLPAMVTRLALLPAAARGTAEALLRSPAVFKVTPKDGAARPWRDHPVDHLALAALAAIALPPVWAWHPLLAFALVPMLLLPLAALDLAGRLRRYRSALFLRAGLA